MRSFFMLLGIMIPLGAMAPLIIGSVKVWEGHQWYSVSLGVLILVVGISAIIAFLGSVIREMD